jgi:geranylgeranyl pyrophosphate synthase
LSFEDYWRKAKEAIDARLEKDTSHLPASVRRVLSGGKRFRGTLTLLTAQALGGTVEKALPFSVAVELVHAGFLIHDDFLDGHETRRGRRPLYRVLDPRRAILVADMLLSMAQAKLTESRDSYKALAKAIYEASKGAFSEPFNPLKFLNDLRRGRISETIYLSLIRLKTAELFGASSKIGAIASDASPDMLEGAYRYGINTGIAYQLADDYADCALAYEGDVDLLTAMKLAPSILYFAPEKLPSFVQALMRRRLGNALALLKEVDMCEKLKAEVAKYAALAEKEAGSFPQNEYTRLLSEAPSFFVKRVVEAHQSKVSPL